ncbi:MAG: protein phosphatase 2C domain-containing protein [Candidatus Eremiobacterota bacterium]
MHLNPTREQIAYVSSAGVNLGSPPVKIEHCRLKSYKSHSFNASKLLCVLLLLLVILFFFTKFVHANEGNGNIAIYEAKSNSSVFLPKVETREKYISRYYITTANEIGDTVINEGPVCREDCKNVVYTGFFYTVGEFLIVSFLFFCLGRAPMIGRASMNGKLNGFLTNFIYDSVIEQDSILKPEEQSKVIAGVLEKTDFLIRKTVFFPAEEAWRIGFGSVTGNVRDKNEDYGMVFKTGNLDIAVIADGCGGMPYGGRASYVATVAAVSYLVTHLGNKKLKNLKQIALGAIFEASNKLSDEARRLDIVNGLRTTLIVVIASNSKVVCSYIGDGGGWIFRSSECSSECIFEKFITPHKGKANNVLTASLGPSMMGKPVIEVLKRNRGDIIITGTDGLFDRVDDFFIKDILKTCIYYKGDFTESINFILNELVSHRDEIGYVFDDNITMSLIGKKFPTIPSSFWLDRNSKKKQEVISV